MEEVGGVSLNVSGDSGGTLMISHPISGATRESNGTMREPTEAIATQDVLGKCVLPVSSIVLVSSHSSKGYGNHGR